MNATKEHISLETAKLFKNDFPYSSMAFLKIKEKCFELFSIEDPTYKPIISNSKEFSVYPAYTWQEILWEKTDQFFGKEKTKSGHGIILGCALYNKKKHIHTVKIMYMLQSGKYKEADLYFREHTIFNQKNK